MGSLGRDLISQADVLIRKAIWTQKDPKNVRTQGRHEDRKKLPVYSQEERPQRKPFASP